MKNKCLLIGFAIYALVAAMSACQKEIDPEPEVNESGIITQQDLDNATTVVLPGDLNIVGNPFGTRTDTDEINSIRDIFTNKALQEPLRAGHIFVIRSFENRNGQRGRLRNIHVMVRRAEGYNPNGGNFEYINIEYDPQNDYGLHPNGILPSLTDELNRGLDIARFACVQCHRQPSATGDFLFTRK